MTGQADVWSKDELGEVARVFTRTFLGSLAKDEQFEADGGLEDGHVWLLLRLVNGDRSSVITLEAAIATGGDPSRVVASRTALLEFQHAVVEGFFRESRSARLPLDFKEWGLDGRTFLFRGSRVNEALEAAADAWLRAHDTGDA